MTAALVFSATGSLAQSEDGSPPLCPDGAGESGCIIVGRYIVELNPGTDVDATVRRLRTQGYAITEVYRFASTGFAANLSDLQADELRADPDVRAVEADRLVYLADQSVPSGVDRVDGETPIPGGWPAVADVDIAIVDTGVDVDHPDLNVVGGMASYLEALAILGFCGQTYTWDDKNGHGTHVAGTAAARDDGAGVIGIAPGARVWAVRVLGAGGSGCLSDLLAGIDWVTAHADVIEVANLSLGGRDLPLLCQAISRSVAAGVVYVAAAGNSSWDARYTSPANCPDVVTVSAVADYDGRPGDLAEPTCADFGADDSLAAFSNFGSPVDIAAPGVCISSTDKGGEYAIRSGTSMATPHVAGAIARYAVMYGRPGSARPDAVLAALSEVGMLTPQQGSCGFAGDRDEFHEPLIYLGQQCDAVSLPAPGPAPLPQPSPAPAGYLLLSTHDVLEPPQLESTEGFGTDMASGDIDGDGIDDLIVTTGGTLRQIVVVPGASFSTASPSQPTVVAAGVGSGRDVLAVGDVNSDGFDDVVVGQPDAIVDVVTSGRVSVFLGPDLVQSSTLTSPLLQNGDEFGAWVAIGDTNVDGAADIAVGAPGADTDAGSVTVFLGPDHASTESLTAPQATSGMRFGEAGAVAGEFIVVGAPGAGVGGAGTVIAFDSASQPLTLESAAASPGFGRSVSTSDLDGDGAVEVIASGDGGVAWFSMSGPETLDDVALAGIRGRIVGGDVNQDGFGDLLIGSDASRPLLLMGPAFDVQYELGEPAASTGPSGFGQPIAFAALSDGDALAFVSDPLRLDSADEASGAVYVYRLLDPDRDAWFDGFDNCTAAPNPEQTNADGRSLPNGPRLTGDDVTLVSSDTLGDACDDDDDNDGLPDALEASWPMALCPSAGPISTTDADSDGDHLADGWECGTGTDPSNPWSGTAKSSLRADADGDHVSDVWELRGYNASPASADSDGDGCGDLVEIASVDDNRYVTQADYLAITRAVALAWPSNEEQDYALDVSKNGVVGDEDRLFAARAALLPDWLPKGCP